MRSQRDLSLINPLYPLVTAFKCRFSDSLRMCVYSAFCALSSLQSPLDTRHSVAAHKYFSALSSGCREQQRSKAQLRSSRAYKSKEEKQKKREGKGKGMPLLLCCFCCMSHSRLPLAATKKDIKMKCLCRF